MKNVLVALATLMVSVSAQAWTDNSVPCNDYIKKDAAEFWRCIERTQGFIDNSVSCNTYIKNNPSEFWRCIQRNGY